MDNKNALLNRSYTDLIKFLACILIFASHYYINNAYEIVRSFGPIGCVLFFFLLAYGIVKSQENKHLSLLPFAKRRLLKVWMPLIVVNFTFVFLACFHKMDLVIIHFPVIGSISYVNGSLLDFIFAILDFVKIDPVTWFLHELIIAYLFIWLLMNISNKRLRMMASIILYLLVEFVFYKFVYSQVLKIDTVGLVLGFIYANYEGLINTYVRKYYKVLVSLSVAIFALSLYLSYAIEPYLTNYFFILDLFAIIYSSSFAVAVIILEKTFAIKRYALIGYLGGLSYYVYLIHMKMIDLTDRIDVFLCLFLILVVSALFFEVDKKLIRL